MDQGVAIERICVRDLERFAAENHRGTVPISRVRAAAQARNPHAAPEDVGLLVARAGDRVVGFLGLLPAVAKVDGERIPMTWLSTWYVAPAYRHLAAGAKLMMQAMRLGRDLAVTGIAGATAGIYEGLQWKSLGPLVSPYLRLDRLNAPAWPLLAARRVLRRRGASVPHALDDALRLARVPFKRAFYRAARGALEGELEGIDVRESSSLGADPFEARDDMLAPVRFLRDAASIRWTLSSRWTVTDRAAATEGYFFSDYRRRHDYAVLHLARASGGNPLGFVVASIVDRSDEITLTVIDDHSVEPGAGLAATLALAGRRGADIVSLPARWSVAVDASRFLGKAFRPGSLTYYRYGKRLAPVASRIRLSAGDGDLPFG